MSAEAFFVPKGVYLGAHSVGPLTRLGRQNLDAYFIEPWEADAADAWQKWLPLIDGFTDALANLLGGKAEHYCPQPSLSSGFYHFLTSLPRDAGRSDVVMHETAFPSMGFVAAALQSRGLSLRLISKTLPADDPNVWQSQINAQTRAVLITHVHSNTGIQSPVSSIATVARTAGASVVVDIAQSAGVIPMHVEKLGADIVLGSCVKWLCGGPGAGFMWVNPTCLASLTPEFMGWFSHANPFEFDIHNLEFAATARRFWGGTPSIAPYATALGGLETITALGVQSIRNHNVALMQTVQPELDVTRHGGTLCLEITDETEARLQARGFRFDRRGRTARFSFHIYNTHDEAQALAACLKT